MATSEVGRLMTVLLKGMKPGNLLSSKTTLNLVLWVWLSDGFCLSQQHLKPTGCSQKQRWMKPSLVSWLLLQLVWKIISLSGATLKTVQV